MQLEPYLFFEGNCEEALTFYKDVFGGEISLMRYEGSPLESEMPPDYKQKVMHGNFKAPTLSFMGADTAPSHHRHGGIIALSLATTDETEGRRVYAKLAEGGTATMPLDKVFWGGLFGMVTDRFGIDWMISCDVP
jgi:PhnB protein